MNSKQRLIQRLQVLEKQNQKIRALQELEKLRFDFFSLLKYQVILKGSITPREIEARIAVGAFPLSSLIQEKLNPKSYAELLKNFAYSLFEIGFENAALRDALGKIAGDKTLALKLGRAAAVNSSQLHLFAGEFSLEGEFLVFFAEAPLLPAFKYIRETALGSIKAGESCQVCGRAFALSVYTQRKRYLLCKTCGVRIHADLFKCFVCGNERAEKLGFLRLEGEPDFQIDYCMECASYLKAADEDALGRISDAALLDIATLDLDAIAREKGLHQRFVR